MLHVSILLNTYRGCETDNFLEIIKKNQDTD